MKSVAESCAYHLPYPSLHDLFEGEAAGGKKSRLPGSGQKPVTERPFAEK